VRFDELLVVRISTGKTAALGRHCEHQRGAAGQDVVKVQVVHRWCDAGGNGALVHRLRGRVVRRNVPLDDPCEPPVVVLAFLHHDPIHLGMLGAVANERADHVREALGRIDSLIVSLPESEVRSVILEERVHRGLPQRFLRAEVVRDEATIHAGGGLDLPCADRIVAALRKRMDCGRQQPATCELGALLDRLTGRHRKGITCQVTSMLADNFVK